MIVNFGCGYDIHPDALNVDQYVNRELGIATLQDVEALCKKNGEAVTEWRLYHVLEHLHEPLNYMQDFWDLSEDGTIMDIRVPYGTTSDAWENPDHKRPYFYSSFVPFSQLYWWRENAPDVYPEFGTDDVYDKPYSADWQATEIVLAIFPHVWDEAKELCGDDEEKFNQFLAHRVDHQLNIVAEMRVIMRANKPAKMAVKGTKSDFPQVQVQLMRAQYE